MSVKVKNYAWHRDWHDKMMADPGYQALGLEERGAYQTLRNLAGITNNNGSLKIGNGEALSMVTAARWLAQTVPGVTGQRARSILNKLVTAGLISESGKSGGRLIIVDWAGDQRCAWSAEAERKRRWRERQQVYGHPAVENGEGGRGMGEGSEFLEDGPPAETSGAAGTGQGMAGLRQLEALPPEQWAQVCCAEAGVFDQHNRNTFSAKLTAIRNRVGDGMASFLFASAIAELRDAIAQRKCRVPPALLTSILRDHAEGRPHNP